MLLAMMSQLLLQKRPTGKLLAPDRPNPLPPPPPPRPLLLNPAPEGQLTSMHAPVELNDRCFILPHDDELCDIDERLSLVQAVSAIQ